MTATSIISRSTDIREFERITDLLANLVLDSPSITEDALGRYSITHWDEHTRRYEHVLLELFTPTDRTLASMLASAAIAWDSAGDVELELGVPSIGAAYGDLATLTRGALRQIADPARRAA